MTEYTVEFQDEDTVLWSFTVTANSEKEAAKKVVQQNNIESKMDLNGIYAFVFESSDSIYESTTFDPTEFI